MRSAAAILACLCLPIGPACSDDSGADGGPDAGWDPDAALPTPTGECEVPVDPVDTSSPDAVVGEGTPESCDEAALDAALVDGGVIAFDCGPDPVTIDVTTEKVIDQDTVIDGGGLVTLDGGEATRILNLASSFEQEGPVLTIQGLTFRNGRSAGPGDDTEVGGGAIYRVGGRLVILDSTFVGNEAPLEGQDVAGGAVYSLGGTETVVVGSTFVGNRASNGGALGNLHNDLTVVNTVIESNAATGTGGNPGNGGNGGGIYIDGVDQDVTLCGLELRDNAGNAFGGGLFRVSNNGVGAMVVDRSTVSGNRVTAEDPSKAGGMYLQGFELEITRSTFSGNEAGAEGALFVHLISSLDLVNTTIAGNTALTSLGGGITIDDVDGGRIVHCTFARNRAPAEESFAAAINGSADNLGNVTLRGSLIADNEAGNAYNPVSCLHPLADGGGNVQWPAMRESGQSEAEMSPCAAGILFEDPGLGPLQENGGPTRTIAPAAGGAADGLATGCPPEDQRGTARSEPCTSGALELD